MNGRPVWVLLVAAMAFPATACGSDPPERSDVLGELAAEGIVPAYRSAAAEASSLLEATTALCSDGAPTEEELDAARTALADARGAWLHTEAVWAGPVMENRSWALVDWPTDTEGVEEAIADPAVPVEAEDLGTKVGADMRGLRTVEYLLGAPGDDSTLEALANERRCAYLLGVTEVVTDELAGVSASWEGEGEPEGYPEGFSDDPDAIDEIVNDALDLLGGIIDMELGAALGTGESEADPSAVVDGPAHLGVADLSDRLAGISMLLVGDDEQPGLSPLLGEDLSERVEEQVAEADEAIAAIEPPLAEAVVQDPESVTAARDALEALRVTLGAEVVSKLGVTIGFSDADGDSAG